MTQASRGNYRPDFSKTIAETYWMNHCQECDTKIGYWFVRVPCEAFFPTMDEEQLKLTGELVAGPFTFMDSDIAVSSWTSDWLRRAMSH